MEDSKTRGCGRNASAMTEHRGVFAIWFQGTGTGALLQRRRRHVAIEVAPRAVPSKFD